MPAVRPRVPAPDELDVVEYVLGMAVSELDASLERLWTDSEVDAELADVLGGEHDDPKRLRTHGEIGRSSSSRAARRPPPTRSARRLRRSAQSSSRASRSTASSMTSGSASPVGTPSRRT